MQTKDYVVSFDRFSYVNENYGSNEIDTDYENDIYEDEEFDQDGSDYQFESLIEEIDEIRENMVSELEYSIVNEGYSSASADVASIKLVSNLIYENAYNLPFLESVVAHLDEAIEELDYSIDEAEAVAPAGPAEATKTAKKKGFVKRNFQKLRVGAKAIGAKLKQAIIWLKKKLSIAKVKVYAVYKKDLKNAGDDFNRKAAAKAKYNAALKKINDEYQAKLNRQKTVHGRLTKGSGKGIQFGGKKTA
jgi:hypothetical protein